MKIIFSIALLTFSCLIYSMQPGVTILGDPESLESILFLPPNALPQNIIKINAIVRSLDTSSLNFISQILIDDSVAKNVG